MKRVMLLMLTLTVSVIAAQKSNDVKIKYKDVSLTFFSQPLVDGKVLPLIDATAGKERFGVHFAKADPATPVVELLDGQGKTIKSLSVNDILGKGVAKAEQLLPANAELKPRRVANIYSIQTPGGEAQLILKAIGTGNESSDDQRLVVTFALKSPQRMSASLRVRLPFSGNAEATTGGVIFTPKSGSTAIAASVFPSSQKTLIEKNGLVVSRDPQTVETSEETALLWFVIQGVSSSSPTDARSQALRTIQENAIGGEQPRLVVVNTADKQRLAQNDTASYTLVCANIGTAEATDVVLGNPVPRGAKFLTGSATTTGMRFNVEGGKTPNEVPQLTWVLSTPIKPGEERIVSFKVVLQ